MRAKEEILSAKRVLLLSPPQDKDYYISVQPPLGILYLASFLRKKDVPVRVMDLKVISRWHEALKVMLEEFVPEIVGISANVFNRDSAIALARHIKAANPSVVVVAGGPQVTSCPHEFRTGDFDFIIPYEGERKLYEFATAEDLATSASAIPCAAVDFTARYSRVQPDAIQELDELPFPAYDLLDLNRYYINSYKKKPIVSIITSRGCPARCIFCSLDVMGKKWRARSPGNVVDEMVWLQNELGVREISIEDDNFTLDLARVSEICRLMKERGVRIPWQLANGIRADRVTRELLEEMRDAGCWKLAIAPEVGDDESRKRIRKGIPSERFREVASWCKDLGIVYYGFFMMGFPFETKETAQRTIDFAIELDPLFMDLSKLLPFKGTDAYRMYSEEQQREHEKKPHYYLNHLGGDWVDEMYAKAYWKFYLRPRKIFEILRKVGPISFLRLLRYAFDVLVAPNLIPQNKERVNAPSSQDI